MAYTRCYWVPGYCEGDKPCPVEKPGTNYSEMFQPVKEALGWFMRGWYDTLTPTSKAMQEYVARGFSLSVMMAPGRMADAADEIINLYQRNDPEPLSATSTKPRPMPIVLVAVANDLNPTGRDYGKQISEHEYFRFTETEDPKQRVFKLRTVSGDIRAQIVILAHDIPTARGLAAQFSLYLDVPMNRRFRAKHRFAGDDRLWPVQIESPDGPFTPAQTGAKNLVALMTDITLKATIPIYTAPADDAPNDGVGTDGDPDDPHGYPVVIEVRHFLNEPIQ